ncbi:hypothetical protein GII33_11870 [Gordonia pseudamarae]|uniref:Uncharacterized protein n=1 Tax=Gordonia pseudamarae TaxID=2831662 RepID=A0ABX6IHV3_9ACTN|nr:MULTISPECIES: hypothetical protein [Gordonia]MBD0023750.1 hypothetical protein [Gordonia sp. (in: high G+C Gram-positive bacteria)]QHN26556.1 hypothetical protein GII33_11870 [Gordonia pseudamarae]QHN35449.1 hypothetical protein GII31_11700 [Gordonia pseudamarae]
MAGTGVIASGTLPGAGLAAPVHATRRAATRANAGSDAIIFAVVTCTTSDTSRVGGDRGKVVGRLAMETM